MVLVEVCATGLAMSSHLDCSAVAGGVTFLPPWHATSYLTSPLKWTLPTKSLIKAPLDHADTVFIFVVILSLWVTV